MFKYEKYVTIKDTLPLISLFSTLISLLELSEGVWEVLFHECYQLCCSGCLDILNHFKIFAFHDQFDFEEEPEGRGAEGAGEDKEKVGRAFSKG